jgi:type IV pilus assembly protein PilB
MRKLGNILVDRGLITPEQLSAAVAEQESSGSSLGRILVDRGDITEKHLVAALATQIGMGFVDLEETEVNGRAATMISEALMRRTWSCRSASRTASSSWR